MPLLLLALLAPHFATAPQPVVPPATGEWHYEARYCPRAKSDIMKPVPGPRPRDTEEISTLSPDVLASAQRTDYLPLQASE